MFLALGFDLDNTLYDQGQHLSSFFEKAGQWLADRAGIHAKLAQQCFIEAWKHRTMSCPFLFDEVLQGLGVWRADWVRDLIQEYRAHRCALVLYEGVRPMLDRLTRRFPLFLITDGNTELQQYKVRELRVSEYFQTIVYTGVHGPAWHKPKKPAFLHAARLLDVAPASCLYTGDDPKRDIQGAHRAGMATARVLSGPYQYQPCWPPPDVVLSYVTALEQVVAAPSRSASAAP